MLLLSIHPKYVEAILAGRKRLELRRRRPRIDARSALIYATSPRMELVAKIEITSIRQVPLDLLWQLARNIACVTQAEFDAYFHGLQAGVAMQITAVTRFRNPIPLSELRDAWPDFHPPQGFRYIDTDDVAKLHIKELRRAA